MTVSAFPSLPRGRTALTLLLPLLLGSLPAAQAADFDFSAYLDAVDQHSLALAAQRQEVVAAQAGIGIAGLRPDPELGWEASREQRRGNGRRPISHGPSLGWTLETGGKRAARIGHARSALALAQVSGDGERHAHYREAASAFAGACLARDALAVREHSLEALTAITEANRRRHRAGDIGGADLLRAGIERDQYRLEVRQALADAQTAQAALAVPLGRPLQEVFGAAGPDCAGHAAPGFDDRLDAALADALKTHDAVRIATASLQQADAALALARANRWVDPTVSVGLSSTRGYPAGEDDGGTVEALPRSRELTVSVSLPLPLSRFNRGDLVQAQAQQTQAMLGLRQAELQVATEVRAVHQQYLAARDTLAAYRNGLLDDAQRGVAQGRVAYLRGASGLLELLDAQRSADEIQLGFLQARADLALATVELQLALGQRPR